MRPVPLAVGMAVVLLGAASGCGEPGSSSASANGKPAAALPAKRKSGAVERFRTRPDLRPPTVRVRRRPRRTAPGHVFIAPLNGPGQDGPMIVDSRGELVWFQPLRRRTAMDFRVQSYRGEPVLTWWQGRFVRGWGQGEYVIADGSYRPVARVKAGNGLRGDHHDFTITPQGTALLTIYDAVRRNLSSVGGARRGTVMDGVLQEVDIETGRVLFEWRSLDRVGIAESYKSVPKRSRDPWDYFHINSADVDGDGNLLISARNTHTVYKVNRRTGAIIWRLGGRKSSFKMGRGARFAWQHDVRRQADGTLSIFDNAASPTVRERSRGLVLAVDTKAMRARVRRKYEHPRGLLAPNKASMQVLPNGNAFLGWGAEPYFSEFSKAGRLLFDARFPAAVDSYRAYRFRWTGRPPDEPAVAAVPRRAGGLTVYASWNGATNVTGWQVLGGARPDALRPVVSGARNGFETAIRVRSDERYVAVQAKDSSGEVIGVSRTVTPSR
ncbi:MAG: arylsulfotransferase family protein [Solirubrobacterales bacterium]